MVHRGVAATVELPDGARVAGTVASVGTVATTQKDATTIEVTVSVKDQKALDTWDQAPVDVVLQAGQAKNVLTVPVNALVALPEGGYGVQVVDGSTTRYVAVKTGMFAGGRVEVSGGGLAEGMTVGVPK
jgi:multidrug efflux pump subunit AcrA (membrane-fusion protein)